MSPDIIHVLRTSGMSSTIITAGRLNVVFCLSLETSIYVRDYSKVQ